MKAKIISLCTLFMVMAQTITFGQKTEVSVREGKVIAETETESAAVDAGRKAILTPDKNLSITVDDPLVADVMEIYKWVEAEKQAQREKIDGTSILINKVESESLSTIAVLLEMPNPKSEASKICQIPNCGILKEPKFYDLQGNLLSFDFEQINALTGDYFVHFNKHVEQGTKFRFICVSRTNSKLWTEGSLWHFQTGVNMANYLNYFRIILPESAIFVDSSRPITVVDNSGGRVAITCRAFTGPLGDGMFHIAFLWPDKDGTTLVDLPPQYRGLRDKKEQEYAENGRLEMAKILAGETFKDQSTPLASIGTLCSAFIHKDRELVISLMANPLIKEIAAQQFDQILSWLGDARYKLIDSYDFLSTPSWPDEPQDGYEHPVYLCRRGSLLCTAIVNMVYRGGQWYWGGMNFFYGKGTESTESVDRPISSGLTISKNKPDLAVATYDYLKPGRFMKKWLFLGPIDIPWDGEADFPDDEAQKKNFDADVLNTEQLEPQIRIGEKDYEWAFLNSEYGVIDLTQVFDKRYVTSYAWAEVNMPEETHAVLGIGSDDSVKVWLNGKLVHKKWVSRGVAPDNDRVPVTFKKGTNQLVLKIQNGGGPWGFTCRLLETK